MLEIFYIIDDDNVLVKIALDLNHQRCGRLSSEVIVQLLKTK